VPVTVTLVIVPSLLSMKTPASFVVALLAVPVTVTEAPVTGVPVWPSTTVPYTEACAWSIAGTANASRVDNNLFI
jgi:hypothetical protein